MARTGSYPAMDLENPGIDFIGLARALGVPGVRCEKISEVRENLGRAFKQRGPFLIDVQLDPSFKP